MAPAAALAGRPHRSLDGAIVDGNRRCSLDDAVYCGWPSWLIHCFKRWSPRNGDNFLLLRLLSTCFQVPHFHSTVCSLVHFCLPITPSLGHLWGTLSSWFHAWHDMTWHDTALTSFSLHSTSLRSRVYNVHYCFYFVQTADWDFLLLLYWCRIPLASITLGRGKRSSTKKRWKVFSNYLDC